MNSCPTCIHNVSPAPTECHTCIKEPGFPMYTPKARKPNPKRWADRRLIGLQGKAGVGKTFVADSLWIHEDYQIVSFGSGIKAATEGIVKYAGFTGDSLHDIVYKNKDVRSEALSQLTSREIQIAIGQGVRQIAPDFWVNLAAREIVSWLYRGYNVVVDDIRQANEVVTIRRLGGVVVKLLPGPASKCTDAQDLPGMADLQYDVAYQLKAPEQYPNGRVGLDVHNIAARFYDGQ